MELQSQRYYSDGAFCSVASVCNAWTDVCFKCRCCIFVLLLLLILGLPCAQGLGYIAPHSYVDIDAFSTYSTMLLISAGVCRSCTAAIPQGHSSAMGCSNAYCTVWLLWKQVQHDLGNQTRVCNYLTPAAG